MSRRIIFFSFIFLFLSACNSILVQTAVPEALLLLPPSEGEYTGLLKQKVTMEARGEQHQFIAVIRLEKTQIKLRTLLPTGQEVLSIDYDGQVLKQDNLSSVALPSEEIFAMIQFALWPETSLKKHYLANNGWQLTVTAEQRLLQTVEGKIVGVDYLSPDELLLKNYQHNYQVRIKTLEKLGL